MAPWTTPTSATSRHVPQISPNQQSGDHPFLSRPERAVAARPKCEGDNTPSVSMHEFLLLYFLGKTKKNAVFIAEQCDICCLTWLKKSGQSGPGSAARQAAALAEEGVDVHVDSMGEYAVELGRFGWFPDRLPREELGDASDEEAEEAGGSRE
ncbi:MGMT family protein, 6-O-methylguanine DNA methyltransferase [Histoplasma ohiense]|nr:MGMT family protein, 6-O-methylguanine DNA methyltransferase [Histoplasma ohiense (nom. inval.)]